MSDTKSVNVKNPQTNNKQKINNNILLIEYLLLKCKNETHYENCEFIMCKKVKKPKKNNNQLISFFLFPNKFLINKLFLNANFSLKDSMLFLVC